jgi:hypothetical protein
MRPCAFWDFATLSAQSSQGICEGRSVTSVAKLHRKLHGYFNDIRVLSFILNGVPNCHHSIQNSELSTAAYGAMRPFAYSLSLLMVIQRQVASLLQLSAAHVIVFCQ